jgi:ribosomal protein L24
MPPKTRGVHVGDHCVVVGGKYGGRQGIVTKFTPMKARVQFDGEEASHLVDQSFIQSGFASASRKVGDQVAIIKGTYVGRTGSIDRFTAQMVYVLLDDGSCPRVCQSSIVCIQSPRASSARPATLPAVYYTPTLLSAPTARRPVAVPSTTRAVRNGPTVLSAPTARRPVAVPSTTRAVRNSPAAVRGTRTAAPPAVPRYSRTVSPTPSCDDKSSNSDHGYQKVRVGVNDDHDVEVMFRLRPSREKKKPSSSSSSSQQRPARQVQVTPRAIRISLEY